MQNLPELKRFEVGDCTFLSTSDKSYHAVFNKTNGFFARWGRTTDEDPSFCPIGPELLDIELSTRCHGVPGVGPCRYCYKGNIPHNSTNMSLEMYEHIINILPKSTLQIALGLSDLDANPEMEAIFSYTREQGIVPNTTINGARLTEHLVDFFANTCGSIAVSRYDRDICYDAVERLSSRVGSNGATLKQVNIHMLLSESTLPDCYELIDDVQNDRRLGNLSSVVFLMLKQVGRGVSLKPLTSMSEYKKLVSTLLDKHIQFGFDSCSANSFLLAIADRPDATELSTVAESCESFLFSGYVSASGMCTPCSFCEHCVEPIDLMKVDNFLEQVWYAPSTIAFRKKLLANNRSCPMYSVDIRE